MQAGREPDRFWPTVAAFGALWGVVEITLGSFLHTLRLPFTGVVLASTGAGLLVAQRMIMPRRGAALATGIVAALCKSLSPGGIILGPMIGISVEAMLVELALLVAPRSVGSAIAAGMLAAMWALFQKLFVQVVFYGATVLELYLALLRRAGDWLGIPPGAGWTALWVLLGVVALIGATGGLLGRRIGRLAAMRMHDRGEAGRVDAGPHHSGSVNAGEPAEAPFGSTGKKARQGHRRFVANGRRRRGFFARFTPPVMAVVCIVLQFPGSLQGSIAALVIWLGVLAVLDRGALRRMYLPRFWAITIAMGLSSGWLLGRPDMEILGIGLSREGFEAGALMVVRGALVFGLTSWAAGAVGARGIRGAFRRVGLASLGGSLSVAVGLLPELQARWVSLDRAGSQEAGGNRLDRLLDSAVRMVVEAADIASDLAGRGFRRQARILAVVGAPGSGKTTRIAQVMGGVRARGLAAGGVCQPAIPGERPDGLRPGYMLRDLATGQERPFAKWHGRGGPDAPHYAFDPEGWVWAGERIRHAAESSDVVVVDELGRLEARGGGHLPAIRDAMDAGDARFWILAVRDDAADAVQRWLGPFDAVVLVGRSGTTGDDPEQVIDEWLSCTGQEET